MEKKFVIENFDKFTQSTTTTTIPMSEYRYTTVILVDYEKKLGTFSSGIRHIKKPDLEILTIDVNYDHEDWVFLRNGKLSFVIDNENIDIEAVDRGTKVIKGDGVREDTSYIISTELLEKIADSKDISMRISGGEGYIDIEDQNAQLFKTMCKQFYNNVFDSTKFAEALESSVLPKDQKSTGSCFIATATMGDYNHPVVIDLRNFRDNWLVKRKWGIRFRDFYYSNGPKAAHFIAKSKILRKFSLFLVIKPLRFLIVKLKLIK